MAAYKIRKWILRLKQNNIDTFWYMYVIVTYESNLIKSTKSFSPNFIKSCLIIKKKTIRSSILQIRRPF